MAFISSSIKKYTIILLLIILCIFIIVALIYLTIKPTTELFTNSVSNCLQHLKTIYKKKICTKTTNDDNNCERITLDEQIILLNKTFSALRCLEYSINSSSTKNTSESEENITIVNPIIKKYSTARKMFVELYQLLYENYKTDINSLVYYQDFMREFYQRYIYYYPIINESIYINVDEQISIPIYSYVKNNNCIIYFIFIKVKVVIKNKN